MNKLHLLYKQETGLSVTENLFEGDICDYEVIFIVEYIEWLENKILESKLVLYENF